MYSERQGEVPLEPVELPDVVERAADAAFVARLSEEREGRRQVAHGQIQPACLAVKAPDARVRRPALAPQIEAPRAREHLGECPQGLVVVSERLEDVSHVMKRAHAQVFVGVMAPREELEALGIELGRLGVRVARPGDVARLDVRRRGEGQGARSLSVSREHLEVLFARLDVLPEREPVGDGVVIFARRRGGREALQRFALEVVLEDVFFVARERTVGQPQEVVALDELPERLADEQDVGRLSGLPDLGGLRSAATRREQASQPEDPAHRRGALEQIALGRCQGRDPSLHGVLHAERQPDAIELLRMDRPVLVLEVARGLEDSGLVVDADDLFEQGRVARREHHGLVHELVELLGFAARRKQVVHHCGRVDVRERSELDDDVTVLRRAAARCRGERGPPAGRCR